MFIPVCEMSTKYFSGICCEGGRTSVYDGMLNLARTLLSTKNNSNLGYTLNRWAKFSDRIVYNHALSRHAACLCARGNRVYIEQQ